MEDYIAKPVKSNGKGIILIHEFWGVNEQIRRVGERLSKEGFKVGFADLYDGKVTANPEEARKLKDAVRDEDALRKIEKVIRALEVPREKIAVWGFCLGGSFAFISAIKGIRVGTYVIYYGSRISDDKKLLEKIQAPVLGVFGGLDKGIPRELVESFHRTLHDLSITHEVYIYPEADHAFFNEERPVYNEKTAQDAWEKTLAFLNKYLS